MNKIIASLVIVLGSTVLLNTAQADKEKDKQVGEADRQKQVEAYQENNRSWTADGKRTASSKPAFHGQSARNIMGIVIIDQRGKDIGRIEDIRLDTGSGRIFYITVAPSGISGPGGEIAVPLEALRFEPDRVLLVVDPDKLHGSPKQADLASDEDFQRDLQRYYGLAPTWQQGSQARQPQNQEKGVGAGTGKSPGQK